MAKSSSLEGACLGQVRCLGYFWCQCGCNRVDEAKGTKWVSRKPLIQVDAGYNIYFLQMLKATKLVLALLLLFSCATLQDVLDAGLDLTTLESRNFYPRMDINTWIKWSGFLPLQLKNDSAMMRTWYTSFKPGPLIVVGVMDPLAQYKRILGLKTVNFFEVRCFNMIGPSSQKRQFWSLGSIVKDYFDDYIGINKRGYVTGMRKDIMKQKEAGKQLVLKGTECWIRMNTEFWDGKFYEVMFEFAFLLDCFRPDFERLKFKWNREFTCLTEDQVLKQERRAAQLAMRAQREARPPREP